jgi:AcrR family transcriptional regulator
MKEEYINKGRTNQKQETRSKILTAANYFIRNGLDFNLEDVAKHSEISRATIYRYYSNTEVLVMESVLDISTLSPVELYDKIKDLSLKDQIFAVQDYFNNLTLNHENAFRKYLSSAIIPNSPEIKRGARRVKVLRMVLSKTDLSINDQKNLANLLTMMMGVEPIIISKDVEGLNNEEAIKLLKSGLEIILRGIRLKK